MGGNSTIDLVLSLPINTCYAFSYLIEFMSLLLGVSARFAVIRAISFPGT
jgi:hypothetical protein